jgi:hypothetical protein
VLGIGVAATLGAFAIGPWAMKLLFPTTVLGHTDLGLLAASAAIFMIAMVLTPALIALHGYWRALVGWFAGCVGFLVVIQFGSDLYGRIERSLIGSAAAACLVMGVLLLPLLFQPSAESDQVTEEFAEAAIHIAGEP